MKNAKSSAKKAFGGVCIFTGTALPDAAHIYPAGIYPQLKNCEYNIVPVTRLLHNSTHACLDNQDFNGQIVTRPVKERLWIIQNLCLGDVKQKVFERLESLKIVCGQKGIEFPEAVKPSDYEALLRNDSD